MYRCYCTLCQKQSGTASNAATLVRQEAFEWLHEAESITIWKMDSGFNSHFCSTCGCPTPNPIGDGLMWVPMGLLDSVDTPTAVHLFETYRPAWDCSSSQDCLSKGVENVEALYNALANHESVEQ